MGGAKDLQVNLVTICQICIQPSAARQLMGSTQICDKIPAENMLRGSVEMTGWLFCWDAVNTAANVVGDVEGFVLVQAAHTRWRA